MAKEPEQNQPTTGVEADEVASKMAEDVLAEAGLSGRPETPDLPNLAPEEQGEPVHSIDLLKDVQLDVKIELGRAEMTINDILRLANGSVVELDKLAGDPVDVLVNEKLVARGEVLVVNDNFCVRINEVLPGAVESFNADKL